MDPNERKVEIQHGTPCRCTIDEKAIYVRKPCIVLGHRVTKKRIQQMLHALTQKQKDQK